MSDDTLAVVLEVVIAPCSPIIVTLMDQPIHESLTFVVGESAARGEEPILKITHSCFAAFEAWQVVLAHKHHFDYNDNFLGLILERQEALLHQFSVFVEGLRSVSAKYLNDFCSQLEWCLFEFYSLSWSVRKEESEVDMHDVTLDIDKNISVVSVLDLENVAQERISCKRLNKVVASLFECSRFRAAELLFEVVYDLRVATHLLFDAVDAEGVIGELDQAASWTSGEDFVWFQPEIELLGFEDLVELANKLHGKSLLSHIIVGFDDDPHDLPGQ